MAMGPIKYTHGRYYCSGMELGDLFLSLDAHPCFDYLVRYYFTVDKLINAYHTRELQVLDDQINNDTIYRSWVFYGRQYYKVCAIRSAI